MRAKTVHLGAIAGEEVAGGIAAVGVLAPASRPARMRLVAMRLTSHSKGPADGLVEVVDVEDEAAVGRGEGAEVADVRVAAELGVDAGVGAEREIVGHDGHGSAEEAEGRERPCART